MEMIWKPAALTFVRRGGATVAFQPRGIYLRPAGDSGGPADERLADWSACCCARSIGLRRGKQRHYPNRRTGAGGTRPESGFAWVDDVGGEPVVSESGVMEKAFVSGDERRGLRHREVGASERARERLAGRGARRVPSRDGPRPPRSEDLARGLPGQAGLRSGAGDQLPRVRSGARVPMLWEGVEAGMSWLLAVAFDLWVANYDRRPPNIGFPERPADRRAVPGDDGRSMTCCRSRPRQLSFEGRPIRSGRSGSRGQAPAEPGGGRGYHATRVGMAARAVPVEFRRAFSDLNEDRRQPVLDQIAALPGWRFSRIGSRGGS